MSDNVMPLHVISTLPIPVERVLDCAQERDLATVVVIGFDKMGDFYFASSSGDGGDVLWLMKLAERRLMDIAEEMTDDR